MLGGLVIPTLGNPRLEVVCAPLLLLLLLPLVTADMGPPLPLTIPGIWRKKKAQRVEGNTPQKHVKKGVGNFEEHIITSASANTCSVRGRKH